MMPADIASLFQPEPVQWGLRGDPWLWREMADSFRGAPLPAQPEVLARLLAERFLQLTGQPLSCREPVGLARHAHGGMSSGMISPQFWQDGRNPCQPAQEDRV